MRKYGEISVEVVERVSRREVYNIREYLVGLTFDDDMNMWDVEVMALRFISGCPVSQEIVSDIKKVEQTDVMPNVYKDDVNKRVSRPFPYFEWDCKGCVYKGSNKCVYIGSPPRPKLRKK